MSIPLWKEYLLMKQNGLIHDPSFVRASNLSRQSIYLLVFHPVALSTSRTQGHHPAPFLDRGSAASADVDWPSATRRWVTFRHVASRRRANDGDRAIDLDERPDHQKT